MTTSTFTPTLRQQVSVCFAYLAYSGEGIVGNPLAPAEMLAIINYHMPQLPPLLTAHGKLDWQVVWGPAAYTFPHAKYQDNMMFVAQQISEPENYVVAVRGTNAPAIWDWIKEDLEVWTKVPWSVPAGVPVQGSPKISRATQDGIDVLLNDLKPIDDIPGTPNGIIDFLTGVAASGKVNILFTGHSLGGALSPTLALWFKQSQKIAGAWDPHGNATVSTVPFAGPTAGEQDFANFFNQQFGSACDRIYNTLDVVPHAWADATLDELPNLYAPTIEMNLAEKALVELIKLTVKDYTQVGVANPITWIIQPEDHPSYIGQLIIQHDDSYPNLLGVPQLLDLKNSKK